MSILLHPDFPNFRDVSVTRINRSSVQISPWSMQHQAQRLPGSAWRVDFNLPPMKAEDAYKWLDFLESLKGFTNTFAFNIDDFVNSEKGPGFLNMRLASEEFTYSVSTAMHFGIQFSALSEPTPLEFHPDMLLIYDTRLSSGDTVILPLRGTVDATVDWGDGEVESVGTGNKDHVYAEAGRYLIRISGDVEQFGAFVDSSKREACLSFGFGIGLQNVSRMFTFSGNIKIVPRKGFPSSINNVNRLFQGCPINQRLDWSTGNVTTMKATFSSAANFNKPITWDTSSVERMNAAFSGASSFNQSLGHLDIGNINSTAGESMANMLNNCGMSVENYSKTLIGWEAYVDTNGGPSNVILGAAGLNYNAGASIARSNLITLYGWTIADAGIV